MAGVVGEVAGAQGEAVAEVDAVVVDEDFGDGRGVEEAGGFMVQLPASP